MDKYEEALEKARAEYEKAREQGYTWLMGLLEGMFPQLKESEDEMMATRLIRLIHTGGYLEEPIRTQILAWLEKQKDKMTAEEYENSELFQLKLKTKYANGYQDGLVQKEQQPAEWSEEDEKMRQRIIRHIESEYQDWCKDKYGNSEIVSDGKESCRERIAWLKSLRPPLKDREMKLKILKYLSTRCSSLEFEEVEDYLNNLRPSWKPSEEQMGMLLAVINDPNNAGAESCHLMLQSLYADLKKLL